MIGLPYCVVSNEFRKVLMKRRFPASCQYQYTGLPGTCGKTRVVPHDCRPKPENLPNRRREMRVLLWMSGWCGQMNLRGRLAVQIAALGAVARRCDMPLATGG